MARIASLNIPTKKRVEIALTYIHGIGEWFHCAPNIPHYAGNKAKFTMKPGHIFTIEPMVNMGSWKDTHWMDGWTAVPQDGPASLLNI